MGNTPVPESIEMSLAKSLKPVQSKTLYTAEAKQGMEKETVKGDAVEIAHAAESQKLASKNTYKEDYKQNVEGKGRTDDKAFPEHAHHKQVAATVSNVEYVRQAQEQAASIQGLPVDTQMFPAAKNAAKIQSDLDYKQ